MRRAGMVATLLIAATCATAAAEERRASEAGRSGVADEAPAVRRDRFVVSGDACGASRYQHLLGREFAQVYQAALLPADAMIQNRRLLRTLEYTPYRLNVVLGGDGRISAIGCF